MIAVAKRLDVDAVVAKSVVEVAFVVVALIAVKFCSVDEAVARRLAVVVRPDTFRVVSVPILVSDERVLTDDEI